MKRSGNRQRPAFDFEQRVELLKRYGNHCMATSLLQPGMSFFDLPGAGFIAFRKRWRTTVALADPVCDPDAWEAMAREVLAFAGRAVFLQVSGPFARMLHERFGYYATQCGIETVIDLAEFNLTGKKKQVIRTAVNRAVKDGVVFRERDADDPETNELTRRWIHTRTLRDKKLTILVRSIDGGFQGDTRRICAYSGPRLIGTIHFDPLYSNGRVHAYVPNISRFDPEFRQGIFYALMVHAIEKFREEGIESINLGLSPFVMDKTAEECESGVLRFVFWNLYRHGNSLYSYRGIHFTKQRFQGRELKTYYAHEHLLPVSLLAFLCLDL